MRNDETYTTHNGIEYYGSSKEKIYADKISAISSKTVFRRSKDLYDLYLLSFVEGFNLNDINYVLYTSERTLGYFDEFLYETEEVRKAYDKLRGIINKPSFEEVYGVVRDFCMPYIECNNESKLERKWDSEGKVWY